LNNLELLEDITLKNDILYIEDYPFDSEKIKGLYCDSAIALSDKLETTTEKFCILAEELGHHFTSSGDITDLKDITAKKQEEIARLWAYNKLIGIRGIVNAFEHGCKDFHEMAEYLNVTEEFLKEAIEKYKSKYGVYTTLDNYIVYFTPMFGVMKDFTARE
jgi:hypothetical protein